MSKIESQLEELGLDKKELRFYMAVLYCGSAPVTIIAERAGVSRTNGYALLAKLENRGLVSQVARDNGVMHIVAEDPQVLIAQWERSRRLLDDVVPQLKSMFNATELKPRIHFYEGTEGILKALRGTLECHNGPLLSILSMNELNRATSAAAVTEIIAERVRRGLGLRALRSQSRVEEASWTFADEELRELRFAPASIDLSMTMYIHDDKVTYLSSRRENYGLVIESKELATLNRAMFEGLWAISDKALTKRE